MLTLFTIPKPFVGAAATAQLNALRSWSALGPEVEIAVCGDEPGTADAAAELGATLVAGLPRTALGTPLVSEAFSRVREIARTEFLAYANADMLLFGDLLTALRRTRTRPALLVGRRVDLDIGEELRFDGPDRERIRGAARGGRRGTERQIDYLVFPRATDWRMPPFAVGRPGWDNWLLYRARALGLAIVDVSRVVLAIHQTHRYDHVPLRTGKSWQGPEADRNRELAAAMGGHAYGLLDATHVLTGRFLLPALGPRHLKRRLRRQRLLEPGLRRAEALLRR